MLEKVSRWIYDNFGGTDDEMDFEDENSETEFYNEEESNPKTSGVYPFSFGKRDKNSKMIVHETPRVKMVVAAPSSFSEARQICDQLKLRRPVVLNLEHVDDNLARRIADFMQGAVSALDATIFKVSSTVVVIGPKDVAITGEYGEIKD